MLNAASTRGITQLILSVEDLTGKIDNIGQTTGVLESVWQGPKQASLVETGFYGIRGKTKRWIEDFLSNRTQLVEVKGKHSYTGSVTSGVPLVYVLGPFLFLIYVKDLGDRIKSSVLLFVDDTILYSVIRTPTDSTQLQNNLTTLEAWERGGWCPSTLRNVIIWLSLRNGVGSPPANERITCAKYLGGELTENLHWGEVHPVNWCKPTMWAPSHTGTLRDAQLLSRHTATRALCDQCWSMCQWCGIPISNIACRTLHDFSLTSNGSALVTQLQLENLQGQKNFRQSLHGVQNPEWTCWCKLWCRSTWAL